MKKYAIIVAGGAGKRMKSSLPKQFLPLNGIPVMVHSILAFSNAGCKVIVVLPKVHFVTFNELVSEYLIDVEYTMVEGGEERFHSVKNGLKAVDGPSLVAIHDAVRPVISTHIIQSSFEKALLKGTAVVAIESKDSLRVKDGTTTQSVNRSDYFIIQTPQTFRSDILLKAYDCSFESFFTDDASVVERAGFEIELVEGDYKNIKVTTPEDLDMAELFLKRL